MRRGRLGRRGGSPASFIKRRRSIGERPAEAAGRAVPGHWEADYMLFARYGQAVLVALERQTRFALLDTPPDRKADRTARCLDKLLAPVAPPLRQTLTVDNGTEFALHYRLTDGLGIETFFCEPRSPWQKGSIENAIGRLRRTLPRKTNLDTPSQW